MKGREGGDEGEGEMKGRGGRGAERERMVPSGQHSSSSGCLDEDCNDRGY